MADSAWAHVHSPVVPAVSATSARHAAIVRITHWLTTLSFLALLVTGVEILISHPRFYWGEAGNIFTRPLFILPIPASRSSVPTGFGFVLPDQNGWSRYLHFQAAWVVVLTGASYVVYSLVSGHLRWNLIPRGPELSWARLSIVLRDHLRFRRPGETEAWSYNSIQRLAYLFVIFILFPSVIWTGLAMSPGFASAFPDAVSVLGGQQSARTLHFFITLLLVLFLVIHVAMICRAGFGRRTRAMITGGAGKGERDA